MRSKEKKVKEEIKSKLRREYQEIPRGTDQNKSELTDGKEVKDRLNSMDTNIERLSQLTEPIKANVDYLIQRLNCFGDKYKTLEKLWCQVRDGVNEISRNTRREEILLELLTDKYKKGIVIIYDEKDPRNIICYQNGKNMVGDTTHQIYFNWDVGTFPTLEIDN